MLTHLRKIFNVVEKEPEMVQEETQAPVLAVDNTAELALAQAALSTAETQLGLVTSQFAELTTAHESAIAQLAAIEAEKVALVATAAATKLEARKQRVELTLGTAKAPAILAATEALDDASFEAIVAAFSANLEVESKSAMFTEVGVSAEAEAIVTDPVAKLAANLAAQFNQKGNK